jgi:hypothetical protein
MAQTRALLEPEAAVNVAREAHRSYPPTAAVSYPTSPTAYPTHNITPSISYVSVCLAERRALPAVQKSNLYNSLVPMRARWVLYVL